MGPFKAAGLSALLRAAPSAVVVPVAIEGSWELARHGLRPIPFGVRVRCTVLAPVGPEAGTPRELARSLEDRIRACVEG